MTSYLKMIFNAQKKSNIIYKFIMFKDTYSSSIEYDRLLYVSII